jgi:hypothetical protein
MKQVAPASEHTQRTYDAIATGLEVQGVTRASMFGMPSLKARDKAFAGLFGDAMVFKLAGDPHAAALALEGAELFDPSGAGRPMKAWVVVPRAHVRQWPELAVHALAALITETSAAKPKPTTGRRKPAKR